MSVLERGEAAVLHADVETLRLGLGVADHEGVLDDQVELDIRSSLDFVILP